MKVISTVEWDGHLTKGKEYEVLYMWKHRKRGRKGNSICGYQVTTDSGENLWMFPEEGYVPLKTKKNPPWRKILKSMGYHRKKSSNLDIVPYWNNSVNGVVLVESLIPNNDAVEYVKDMENYFEVLDGYYMEMENIWTEGETV